MNAAQLVKETQQSVTDLINAYESYAVDYPTYIKHTARQAHFLNGVKHALPTKQQQAVMAILLEHNRIVSQYNYHARVAFA